MKACVTADVEESSPCSTDAFPRSVWCTSPPLRTSGAGARCGRAAASFPTHRRPRRSGRGRRPDGCLVDEGLARDGEAAAEGRVIVGDVGECVVEEEGDVRRVGRGDAPTTLVWRVGGVVGDERGDALEDDPLAGGRPVDEVRVMATIVSNKCRVTSSRLTSSALQSPCKMSGAKWMRCISVRARFATSSSMFGMLCSSWDTVLSGRKTVKTTRRLTLMENRCVSMLSDSLR